MAIVERDGIPGKICNRCGEWKPVSSFSFKRRDLKKGGDGFLGTCKDCFNAEKRAERSANIEEHRAKQRAYYRDHAEVIKAQVRAYRERNPERRKQTDLEYYEKNRERRKAYQRVMNRERRAADPDGVNRYNKLRLMIRRERDPEGERIKRRNIENRRRAQEYQAPGSHTEEEWQDLKARYCYTCLCCRRREPEIVLTRDHVIPLTKHGSNYIENIQPLCFSCNSSKGTKTTDYRPDWTDSEE